MKKFRLLIGTSLLVLFGLDVWVRIYLPQPFSHKLSLHNFAPATEPTLQRLIEKDGPNERYLVNGETNHLGFHDVEHAIDLHPGIYRIVLLGDSFAEVEHFPLKDTWFTRLENELETRLNQKIEIVNLGIRGAGTGWELFILEKLGLPYQPDMVILAFHLGSDFLNNHPRLEVKIEKPLFKISKGKVFLVDEKETELLVRGVWLPLWRLSHLYRYLHRRLYNIVASSRAIRNGMPIFFEQYLTDPPSEWDESEVYTEFFLKQIRGLTDKIKCQLVVVGIPDKYQIHTDWWNELKKKWPVMLKKKWDMDTPRKRLIKILNNLDIPFIDLTPKFHKEASLGNKLYFEKDLHWNLRGNMVAAEAISEHIVEYIK